MTYVKKISDWHDPGGQKMDMTQNCSLLQHKGNFPRKSRNNKTAQICLKYSLSCAGASILERYLKNNRLSLWCTFQILGGCQSRRTRVGVTTVSNSLILRGWVTKVSKNGDKK